jgi:hypothetical protein
MTSTLLKASIAVVTIALIGLIGRWDSQAEVAQAERYCEMVEKGAWPDYEHRYQQDCVGGSNV